MHLSELLASFDRDSTSSLDSRELGGLSRFLLGEELSTASVKYLLVGGSPLAVGGWLVCVRTVRHS